LAGAAPEFLVETCLEIRRLPPSSKAGKAETVEAGRAALSPARPPAPPALPPPPKSQSPHGKGDAAEVVRGEAVERSAEGGETVLRATASGVFGSVAAASGRSRPEENARDRGKGIPRSPFEKVPEWR